MIIPTSNFLDVRAGGGAPVSVEWSVVKVGSPFSLGGRCGIPIG